MVLHGKSSQEYPVNGGVVQGSILDPTLFLDDTTLYSKCDQASDLWQQLELTAEIESDLPDTVNRGKNRLVDINA